VKILISAYACEPRSGSEQGTGWSWARAAAIENEVWLLTQHHHREGIEKALVLEPDLEMTPVFVSIPKWVRWLVPESRSTYLHYGLWQLFARTGGKEDAS